MQLVLLRRCMYRTARVVLCQSASVTTAPCRIDLIGSPEQALNLLLLAASPVRDTENYDEIPTRYALRP